MMGVGPDSSFVERAVAEFRARADDRAREDSPAAAVYRRVADDLEQLYVTHYTEPLALATACAESGYSPSGLRGLMRRLGLQQITRADLPRLARLRDAVAASSDDIAQPEGPGLVLLPDATAPVRSRPRAPRPTRGKVRVAKERVTATAAILSR